MEPEEYEQNDEPEEQSGDEYEGLAAMTWCDEDEGVIKIETEVQQDESLPMVWNNNPAYEEQEDSTDEGTIEMGPEEAAWMEEMTDERVHELVSRQMRSIIESVPQHMWTNEQLERMGVYVAWNNENIPPNGIVDTFDEAERSIQLRYGGKPCADIGNYGVEVNVTESDSDEEETGHVMLMTTGPVNSSTVVEFQVTLLPQLLMVIAMVFQVFGINMDIGVYHFMISVIPWIRRLRGLLLPAVLFLMMIHGGCALTAYDCQAPQLSGSYSLLALKQCREANPDVIKKSTAEVYLYEAPKTQEVTVRACKVMVAFYISHCGTASHTV